MRRNYFYNLLLTVFNLLLPVASFPYVSRILGPSGIGAAQFALTFSQYIALLAALGVPIYGVREIGRVREDPELLRHRVSELFSIHLLSSVAFAAILLILLCFRLVPNADYRLLWWGGSLVLLSFFSIEWLFTGLEAFRTLALRSIVIKSLALLAIFIAVQHPTDTGIYFAILLASMLVTNVLNVWTMRHLLRFRISKSILRRHAPPLLYIFGTTLASTLYTTFDSVLLGMLSDNRAVGLYTTASKVAKLSLPLIMAYGGTLIPRISQGFARNDEPALRHFLNSSYNYIILIAVPVSAMLFALAPGLIRFFSGEQFADAIPGMRIMSAFPLLIGLGYFWGYQVILPLGRDRLLLHAAVCGTVLSLLLNVLLVPAFGADGAAIAGVGAEVLVTIMYITLVRRYLHVRIDHRVLWESAIACLPIFTCAFLPERFVAGSLFLTLCVQAGGSLLVYLGVQVFIFRNAFVRGILQKLPVFRRVI